MANEQAAQTIDESKSSAPPKKTAAENPKVHKTTK
jgi:hypothetical protein